MANAVLKRELSDNQTKPRKAKVDMQNQAPVFANPVSSNGIIRWRLLCALLLIILSSISGAKAAQLDNGIDPANLGKGEWIYVVSSAVRNLSDSGTGSTVVSSVNDVPSMMSYFKTELKLQWITVKAGTGSTNFPSDSNPQFNAALVDAAHAQGIKIFGYTRSYGTDLPGELAVASRCFEAGADGFIFDAETEWRDVPNNALAAWQLLGQFKTNWPSKFLGHSPLADIYYVYGNASAFPYKEFGYWCDCVMPQVYWASWSESSSSSVNVYGTPVKGIQWLDSNFNKYHSWLGTFTTNTPPTFKDPTGVLWTSAIKPIAPIGQADSPGATNQTYKDITNFVGYLKRDANCASPTGYKGCSFFRVGLQDTNNLLRGIADSTIGEPVITTQPAGHIVNVGSAVELSVAATGSGDLTYQWLKNGVPVNHGLIGTGPTLSIPSIQLSDAGNYTVVVGNFCGSVTSSVATLSITGSSAPAIITHPQSETVIAGDHDGLSVEATGSMPLYYQWYFNGEPISGATISALPMASVQPSQAGDYCVVVSNSIGSVTSSVASVQVNYAIRVNVTGNGTVSITPNRTSYEPNSEVTLAAIPGSGSTFLNWAGDASGTENQVSITITTNRTVEAVFSALAMVPETLVVESRIGGVNYPTYYDASFASSTLKSTAPGCTLGIGCRYAWTNAAYTRVMPMFANAGGLYQLEVTHGSASSVSSNIMVKVTLSGGVFTKDNSPTLWTPAFRQANPNVWKNVGKFRLDPGVTQATFTFTTTNTDLTASGSRFVSDAYRFTALIQNLPSTTVVSSSTNGSLYGDAVTFRATVTGEGGTPTGSVTFYDQGVNIGNASLDVTGVAVLTINALDAARSPHGITASYSGDATYLASTSTMLSHYVSFATPTIKLKSSSNPVPKGSPVTFTATINGTDVTPTGSATFFDGETVLATVALNSSGVAKFTTSSLEMDIPHLISVYYSGDGGYNSGYSSSLSQAITLPGTSTELRSSPNPALAGQQVFLTATVIGMFATPSGTVTFQDGNTILGTAPLDASGAAGLIVSNLSVAGSPHTLTATYNGSSEYAASTSSNVLENIILPSTTTVLTSSTNPVVSGKPLVLNATVSSQTGIPTGTVTFWDGTTSLGTSTLVSNVAKLTVSNLSVSGSPHPLTATYNGSSNFGSSTSSTLYQEVVAPAGGQLRFVNIWNIEAGSRPYVTTSANERGIALNTLSNHVLIVTRSTTPASIYVLDAETGDEVVQGSNPVKLNVTGVSGGTYVLNKIGVADDGVIYAANLTTATNSPFKIYRWSNYSSAPTLAYSGAPGGNITVRWGDTMAVRGAGTNTQIIVGGNTANATTNAIIFTTANGTTFTANRITPASASVGYDLSKGLCWADGNSFYAKARSITTGKKFNFNLTTKTYSLANNVSGLDANVIAIDADTGNKLLAGVLDDNTTNSANHRLVIYSVESSTPTLLSSFGFLPVNGSAIANPNIAASVACGGDKIIALDTQNGLVAVRLVSDSKTDSTVTLASSANPAVYGETVTLTADVHGGENVPTGSVAFLLQSNVIGTATLDASGRATFSTSALLPNTINVLNASYSGDDSYNPSISFVLVQTITRAPVTIAGFNAQDKVYDGTTAATLNLDGASLVGVLSGDAVTLNTSALNARFADKNAGTAKAVNITGLALAGVDAAKYTLVQPATQATIMPRNLTVLADGNDKVYDGTIAATVRLLENRVAGDELTITCTGASFADKNAGTNKPVSVHGISVTGPDAANYFYNTRANTTASIVPRPITATATPDAKTYDGTATSGAVPTITSGSLAQGDSASFAQAFDNKDAGTSKTLIPSGTLSDGNGGANYAVTLASTQTGVIVPAALTVTAEDATREFGQPDPAFAVRYSGFIAGEDATVLNGSLTFTTGTTATSPLGTYPITPGGLTAQNYSITFVPGVFTIYGWPPSITSQPISQTGNAGTTVVFTVVAEGTSPLTYQWTHNGIKLAETGNIIGASSASLTVANIAQVDAGEYTVSVTNGIGQAVSAPARLTVIDPPSITVQPSSLVANLGKTAIFSVVANGTEPTYQWMQGTTPLADGGKIAGSQTASLTVNDVTEAEEGAYSVVISNPAGTVTSETVTLSVIEIKVAIKAPAAERFARTKLKLMGSASDIDGTLAQVLYQINGGAFLIATACPGNDGLTDWYADIQLVPGTNVISAKAVDVSGCESDLATRTYFVMKVDYKNYAGTYNGLFYETTAVNHERSGFIRIDITSGGTYSGKFWIGGQSQSISGKFDDNGDSQSLLNGADPVTVNLQLDIENNSGLLSGKVANSEFEAPISASKVATEVTPVTYSLVFLGAGEGGSATVSIAADGLVTLAGKLADGTTIASKGAYVAQNGDLPLYIPLYGNAGSLLGWLTKGTDDLYSGAVSWIKTGASGFTLEMDTATSKVIPQAEGSKK